MPEDLLLDTHTVSILTDSGWVWVATFSREAFAVQYVHQLTTGLGLSAAGLKIEQGNTP
jgi:hypothetical protein